MSMSKPKRITLGVMVALIILAGLTAGGRVVLRPAMPDEWHGLRKGMTRDQILAAALGQHADMLELKGFDLFTRETTMLGEPCYWQLYVSYDRTGGIMNAQPRFVHRRFSLLSCANPDRVL